MNKKEIAGWGSASLVAPMLLGAMTMSVAIGASGTDFDEQAGADSSSAAVTSTVATEELCTWYLLGAPSSLALSAGVDGDGDPVEYEGTALSLSAQLIHADSASLTAYASGNETGDNLWADDGFSECTFYGEVTRPIVTVELDGIDFTAAVAAGETDAGAADSAVSFSATAQSELTFDFETRGSTCTSWTVADINVVSEATKQGVPMKVASLDDVGNPVNVASDAKRCSRESTISTTVPASLTPTYPGQDYVWTGPTVTYTLRTSGTSE
jgi:hypothetical protein